MNKLRYSTGKAPNGYLSGMEGTYEVLDILDRDGEMVVHFFSKMYGAQSDVFRNGRGRVGFNGFKVGNTKVSASDAKNILNSLAAKC